MQGPGPDHDIVIAPASCRVRHKGLAPPHRRNAQGLGLLLSPGRAGPALIKRSSIPGGSYLSLSALPPVYAGRRRRRHAHGSRGEGDGQGEQQQDAGLPGSRAAGGNAGPQRADAQRPCSKPVRCISGKELDAARFLHCCIVHVQCDF